MKEQIIFEDFIQDREVRMYDKHFSDMDNKEEYDVYVQVFTIDNLPFSSVTGKLEIYLLIMIMQVQKKL